MGSAAVKPRRQVKTVSTDSSVQAQRECVGDCGAHPTPTLSPGSILRERKSISCRFFNPGSPSCLPFRQRAKRRQNGNEGTSVFKARLETGDSNDIPKLPELKVSGHALVGCKPDNSLVLPPVLSNRPTGNISHSNPTPINLHSKLPPLPPIVPPSNSPRQHSGITSPSEEPFREKRSCFPSRRRRSTKTSRTGDISLLDLDKTSGRKEYEYRHGGHELENMHEEDEVRIEQVTPSPQMRPQTDEHEYYQSINVSELCDDLSATSDKNVAKSPELELQESITHCSEKSISGKENASNFNDNESNLSVSSRLANGPTPCIIESKEAAENTFTFLPPTPPRDPPPRDNCGCRPTSSIRSRTFIKSPIEISISNKEEKVPENQEIGQNGVIQGSTADLSASDNVEKDISDTITVECLNHEIADLEETKSKNEWSDFTTSFPSKLEEEDCKQNSEAETCDVKAAACTEVSELTKPITPVDCTPTLTYQNEATPVISNAEDNIHDSVMHHDICDVDSDYVCIESIHDDIRRSSGCQDSLRKTSSPPATDSNPGTEQETQNSFEASNQDIKTSNTDIQCNVEQSETKLNISAYTSEAYHEEELKTNHEEESETSHGEELRTNHEEELKTNIEEESKTNYEKDLKTNYEAGINTKHEEALETNHYDKLKTKHDEEVKIHQEEELEKNHDDEAKTSHEEELKTNHEEKMKTNYDEELNTNHEEEMETNCEEGLNTGREKEMETNCEEELKRNHDEELKTYYVEELKIDHEEELKINNEEELKIQHEEEQKTNHEEELEINKEEALKTKFEKEPKTKHEEEWKTSNEKELKIHQDKVSKPNDGEANLEEQRKIDYEEELKIKYEEELKTYYGEELKRKNVEENKMKYEEDVKTNHNEQLKINNDTERNKNHEEEMKTSSEEKLEINLEGESKASHNDEWKIHYETESKTKHQEELRTNYDRELRRYDDEEWKTKHEEEMMINYEKEFKRNHDEQLYTIYEEECKTNDEEESEINHEKELKTTHNEESKIEYETELKTKHGEKLMTNYDEKLKRNADEELKTNHEEEFITNNDEISKVLHEEELKKIHDEGSKTDCEEEPKTKHEDELKTYHEKELKINHYAESGTNYEKELKTKYDEQLKSYHGEEDKFKSYHGEELKKYYEDESKTKCVEEPTTNHEDEWKTGHEKELMTNHKEELNPHHNSEVVDMKLVEPLDNLSGQHKMKSPEQEPQELITHCIVKSVTGKENSSNCNDDEGKLSIISRLANGPEPCIIENNVASENSFTFLAPTPPRDPPPSDNCGSRPTSSIRSRTFIKSPIEVLSSNKEEKVPEHKEIAKDAQDEVIQESTAQPSASGNVAKYISDRTTAESCYHEIIDLEEKKLKNELSDFTTSFTLKLEREDCKQNTEAEKYDVKAASNAEISVTADPAAPADCSDIPTYPNESTPAISKAEDNIHESVMHPDICDVGPTRPTMLVNCSPIPNYQNEPTPAVSKAEDNIHNLVMHPDICGVDTDCVFPESMHRDIRPPSSCQDSLSKNSPTSAMESNPETEPKTQASNPDINPSNTGLQCNVEQTPEYKQSETKLDISASTIEEELKKNHEEKLKTTHEEELTKNHEEDSKTNREEESQTDHDEKLMTKHEEEVKIHRKEEFKTKHEEELNIQQEDELKTNHKKERKTNHEEEFETCHEEESKTIREKEFKTNHEEEFKTYHEEEPKTNREEELKKNHEEELKTNFEEELKTNHEEELKTYPEEDSKVSRGEELKTSHEEELKMQHEEELKMQHGEELKMQHEEELKMQHEEELKMQHEEELKTNHEEELTIHHKEEPKINYEEELKITHDEELNPDCNSQAVNTKPVEPVDDANFCTNKTVNPNKGPANESPCNQNKILDELIESKTYVNSSIASNDQNTVESTKRQNIINVASCKDSDMGETLEKTSSSNPPCVLTARQSMFPAPLPPVSEKRPEESQLHPPSRLPPLSLPGRPIAEPRSSLMLGRILSLNKLPTSGLCAGDGERETRQLESTQNSKGGGDGVNKIRQGSAGGSEGRSISEKSDEASEQGESSQRFSQQIPAFESSDEDEEKTTDDITWKKYQPAGYTEIRELSAGSSRQSPSSPPPFVLDKSMKDDIKRQTLEEGLKPAMSDGGVAFFIPVTEDGLQPPGGSIDITERITKNKKCPLKYEERMMLADINREQYISGRKGFATVDLQRVKAAAARPNPSPSDTESDKLDEEFGL